MPETTEQECQHKLIWCNTSTGVYQCGSPEFGMEGCGRRWKDVQLEEEIIGEDKDA
ncbi:MAG: hypothetical protein V2A53_02630 [bacterium]